jgi:hypothetical protein
MKIRITIPLLLFGFLLSGCAGTRRIATDTAGAGLGALVGNKLGKGKPLATVAGAGTGVLAGEALNYLTDAHTKATYEEGFDKGRSDAAKQQYWIMVNHQKAAGLNGEENFNFYEIPFPEQKVDGVLLNPTTKVLRIGE